MKRNASHSRSSIFLMEIIIAICFFSLVSAVCLQVFVRAKQYSQATTNLNMAVADVSAAAEIVRGSRGVEETMRVLDEQYPDGWKTGDGFGLYFDRDWKICGAGDEAAYQVLIKYDKADAGKAIEDGSCTSWTITAAPASPEFADEINGDEIYSLSVEVYEDAE